ncbi:MULTISPECIES: hypothetical protein [Vibrio harveyi group]|uniref:Uncharacterized protein n=1 Tax=Vibrio rotiferianus TaxID=190895 RepID=A0A510I641_9VIBR|nr:MULTISPECIES: hypothetical protein [Vibrio harveyi group]MCC3859432.1 hypothetical protein [Vibrio parahaemolyticus]MDF5034116.1 hypothetical protein [Vibrio parahaemolyticus]CAH1573962.1 hypothetical protein THOE12_330008 [Vibrio rotiferianus]BBL87370.1 hypothetical protein VroAM7_00230 [Vibrio rotiferianus]BBL87906.1 hypothetical protein VroAM7_05590 [Vibrio rotiferianus]
MNEMNDLQLSLSEDNGFYNFALKGEIILSVSLNEMDIDSANKVYDAIMSAMNITLSTASENMNGAFSFTASEDAK